MPRRRRLYLSLSSPQVHKLQVINFFFKYTCNYRILLLAGEIHIVHCGAYKFSLNGPEKKPISNPLTMSRLLFTCLQSLCSNISGALMWQSQQDIIIETLSKLKVERNINQQQFRSLASHFLFTRCQQGSSYSFLNVLVCSSLLHNSQLMFFFLGVCQTKQAMRRQHGDSGNSDELFKHFF